MLGETYRTLLLVSKGDRLRSTGRGIELGLSQFCFDAKVYQGDSQRGVTYTCSVNI